MLKVRRTYQISDGEPESLAEPKRVVQRVEQTRDLQLVFSPIVTVRFKSAKDGKTNIREERGRWCNICRCVSIPVITEKRRTYTVKQQGQEDHRRRGRQGRLAFRGECVMPSPYWGLSLCRVLEVVQRTWSRRGQGGMAKGQEACKGDGEGGGCGSGKEGRAIDVGLCRG